MADDAEKTEDYIILNEKGRTPFCYAKRYAAEVKSFQDFVCFSRRY